MPELPEVETTLRGITPHIIHKTIQTVLVRQTQLRWPILNNLAEILADQCVQRCYRRAKYMIIEFNSGNLLIHLGMSGSLRIFHDEIPKANRHDHVDFIFHDGTVLRYHDPRRFGAILWFAGAIEHHPLLIKLGVEPLSDDFSAEYLFPILQKQSRPIKTALMDGNIVVGVGNIYANESLFQAAILPKRAAKSLNFQECTLLVATVKEILLRAIDKGGSTLRDFVNSTGQSGYFQQEYRVYGRTGLPCLYCAHPIEKIIIGQRGTFYCPVCQY